MATVRATYYRTATIESAVIAQFDQKRDLLSTAKAIETWLLDKGPVYARYRWQEGNAVDHLGRLMVKGKKGGRIDCAFVGFDESRDDAPFRMLTPFGSGWGEIGRCWVTRDDVRKLLRNGMICHGIEK